MEMEIGMDYFESDETDADIPGWSDESLSGIEDAQALSFAVEVVSQMYEDDGPRSNARGTLLREMDGHFRIEPHTEDERSAALEAVERVLLMYEGRFRGTSRRSALRRIRDKLRLVKHIVSYPVPAERTWCGRAVDAVEPQAQVRSTEMKGHTICDACKGTADHVLAVLEAGMYPERTPDFDR